MSTNAGAHTKITFNVTYQQVLQRVNGVYKHVINVKPRYVSCGIPLIGNVRM